VQISWAQSHSIKIEHIKADTPETIVDYTMASYEALKKLEDQIRKEIKEQSDKLRREMRIQTKLIVINIILTIIIIILSILYR